MQEAANRPNAAPTRLTSSMRERRRSFLHIPRLSVCVKPQNSLQPTPASVRANRKFHVVHLVFQQTIFARRGI
jgi:hypothetical protein